MAQVVNVRGVIYQKLNIGRQIANRWIYQWVKYNLPLRNLTRGVEIGVLNFMFLCLLTHIRRKVWLKVSEDMS